MNASAHTSRRFVSVTGLAAVIAALAVPTALARPTIEGTDSAYRTPVTLDLRSPDTLDTTTQALGVDPAIATAMAAHRGLNLAADLRSPDTREMTTQVPGVDPAIATAIAGHQRLNVAADLRSPDVRDVAVNPSIGDAPVAVPAAGDSTNWGVVAAILAAIAVLIVGVGAIGAQGHGKRHGSMKPA